jgi:hypothetical protein
MAADVAVKNVNRFINARIDRAVEMKAMRRPPCVGDSYAWLARETRNSLGACACAFGKSDLRL